MRDEPYRSGFILFFCGITFQVFDDHIEYIKKNGNKDSSEDGSLQHADCKRCSDDGEHQGGNIETRQQYDTDDGKDSF